MSGSCGICSACNDCNNGPTGPTGQFCNTRQDFCSFSQRADGDGRSQFNFDFGPFATDDIIIKLLPKAEFNAMGAAVEAMANYGNLQDSGGWTWDPETRDFIFGQKTRELEQGINSLGGGTTVPLVAAQNIIITGAHFTTLANAINNMLLRVGACHVCNVSCAVACQSCDSCDECEYLPCYTDCHSDDS